MYLNTLIIFRGHKFELYRCSRRLCMFVSVACVCVPSIRAHIKLNVVTSHSISFTVVQHCRFVSMCVWLQSMRMGFGFTILQLILQLFQSNTCTIIQFEYWINCCLLFTFWNTQCLLWFWCNGNVIKKIKLLENEKWEIRWTFIYLRNMNATQHSIKPYIIKRSSLSLWICYLYISLSPLRTRSIEKHSNKSKNA